jgi:hypothetical protein
MLEMDIATERVIAEAKTFNLGTLSLNVMGKIIR